MVIDVNVHPVQADSPFPGAKSYVNQTSPGRVGFIDRMKSWGKDGSWISSTPFFVSAGSSFQTDGVQMGDEIFFVQGNPPLQHARTVMAVLNETTLNVGVAAIGNFSDVWFKVGFRDTFRTNDLLKHLGDAGPYSAMMRWGHIWSNAPYQDWDETELGKLICIRKP